MTSIQPRNDGDALAPLASILIVEDDPLLAHTLQAHLRNWRYHVRWAADGSSGLQLALLEKPDLVLLDIGLPEMDGREVCRRLRAESDVPILFMTSLRAEDDIVTGLYQGADGYICKPFGLAELGARVEATLRRRALYQQRTRISVYDDDVLFIDVENGIVRKRGQDVSLAPKEIELLCYLVRHAGEVVSHQELLQSVWGAQYVDARNYLSLYMRYLRRKIEDNPTEPQYLMTRFGIGYCFRCHMENGETGSRSIQ
jgi:DNA-binding response OmpR family regulator